MPKGIPRDQSIQRNVLHRLKISKGHLEKIIKMVDDDEYCIDVVHQSKALQAALKKVDQTLLENHLKTCVLHDIGKGHEHSVIEEIVEVVKKS